MITAYKMHDPSSSALALNRAFQCFTEFSWATQFSSLRLLSINPVPGSLLITLRTSLHLIITTLQGR